ncbi:hypothetical protein ACS0TY_027108 [Phlomoides rotata]
MSTPPDHPRQYPEAIQVKLYQAFIFSIPILFSIILFLLFYLFYLKRRALPSPPPSLLPTTHAAATTTTTAPCDSDFLKNHELKNKLCQILFDECMKARYSLCCVCLGEFEVKEELVQVAACKHIFHIHCIRHWLQNNSTCPLCRAPVNLPPDYYYFYNNDHLISKSRHHQPPNFPAPPPPTQMLQLLHYTITSSHHAAQGSSSTTAAS